jgi:glycine/D-amino acid oxidase-like deaminating enzyme
MNRKTSVAVLGAGIMGSATALFLARRGVRVVLFDAAPAPFSGASRWNEGKIHLGYLYSADRSLDTARRVLPGGLAFKGLTEHLIGRPLDDAITPHDDTYLVHRNSVTGPDAMHRYIQAVTSLTTSHPNADGYLVDLTKAGARRLSSRELEAAYDTQTVVAGYRVPERSVSTARVADHFVDALRADPTIELAMQTRIVAVRALNGSLDGPLVVDTEGRTEGPFDFVVNALWEGRLAIDAGLGIRPPADWSHRFRLSVFLRTRKPVSVPSTVLATGPFGDVKNYDGTNFYLSWYPTGLVAEGGEIAPPPVPELDDVDRKRITRDILARLGRVIHAVDELRADAEETCLRGGWVFALGNGSLADPASTLHRRDRVGIHRAGAFISVDTGKYSIAPWLARQVADSITDT